MNNKEIGKLGEDFTIDFLNKRGFIILERNYKVPLGEVDIIAQKGDLLIFIEVKTRRNLDLAYLLKQWIVQSRTELRR